MNDNMYNNFNLLRLLAALQVVYIHSVSHLDIQNEIALFLSSLLSYFPGVPIFFLISGYLITMSYEKNLNLKEYTKNRALRIFPGLYVSFLIGLIILWYFNQFDDVNIVTLFTWIAAQLTLFQFYNPEFIRDFGVGVINGSLWTISVELTFYILLPFIYLFLKKHFYIRLTLLFLISLGFYYYVQHISSNIFIYEKLIRSSILPYLFYFLLGLYFYKYRKNLVGYLEDKVFLYLGLYILVSSINVDFFIYTIFEKVIFTLLIFSSAFSYKKLSYTIMRHNDFTYGIYIYHMLIINTFIEINYRGEIQSLLAVFLLSFIFGVLSYLLLEKPFLKMKKKSLYVQIHKNN